MQCLMDAKDTDRPTWPTWADTEVEAGHSHRRRRTEWKDIHITVCGSGFVNRRGTTRPLDLKAKHHPQIDHFTGSTSPFITSVDQQIMIFWVVWFEFPSGASPVMTCWQLSAKPVGGAQVFIELGWSDRWSQDRINVHPLQMKVVYGLFACSIVAWTLMSLPCL